MKVPMGEPNQSMIDRETEKSVSQLKAYLRVNGVSVTGVTEKSELALLAARVTAGGEALQPKAEPPAAPAAGPSLFSPGPSGTAAVPAHVPKYGTIRCDEVTFQKWAKSGLRPLLVNLERVLWDGSGWEKCSMSNVLSSADAKVRFIGIIKHHKIGFHVAVGY